MRVPPLFILFGFLSDAGLFAQFLQRVRVCNHVLQEFIQLVIAVQFVQKVGKPAAWPPAASASG